jgi:hypothetical protein
VAKSHGTAFVEVTKHPTISMYFAQVANIFPVLAETEKGITTKTFSKLPVDIQICGSQYGYLALQ